MAALASPSRKCITSRSSLRAGFVSQVLLAGACGAWFSRQLGDSETVRKQVAASMSPVISSASILGLGRWKPAGSLARAVERFQFRRR
jgi:uncharacterized protein YfiM (DUF2279 family)